MNNYVDFSGLGQLTLPKEFLGDGHGAKTMSIAIPASLRHLYDLGLSADSYIAIRLGAFYALRLGYDVHRVAQFLTVAMTHTSDGLPQGFPAVPWGAWRCARAALLAAGVPRTGGVGCASVAVAALDMA